MKDYYKIIGVNRNAEASAIKNTYLLKLKKYHPDVYLGDKEFAEEKTRELNEAYDVLKDEIKRKEYDEKLNKKKSKDLIKKSKIEKEKNWFQNSWDNIKQIWKNLKKKRLERKKKKYAKKLQTSENKLTNEQIEMLKDKRKLTFLILVMLIAIIGIIIALV